MAGKKKVFCFQPHASLFFASPEELVPLPVDMSPDDAVFLPFMETAVNFVMDGAPLLNEKIAVFGQGVLGLLTQDCWRAVPRGPGSHRAFPLRRKAALSRGADLCFNPGMPGSDASLRGVFSQGNYDGADMVYELTGDPAVLDQAVALAGFNGRIIVGSWYGTRLRRFRWEGIFTGNAARS